MPSLIVQADDLAISHAATLGIMEAATKGLVRATGIFTNQPDAAFAAEALRDLKGLDIGLDLNVVTGRPLLPADQVPGLVQADGRFRTSHQIKAAYPVVGGDGVYQSFDPEPFDHEQTLAEARAQVDRFYALFDRPPVYLHHHSLVSDMSDQVLHEVAAERGLLVMDDLYRSGRVPLLPNPWYVSPFGPTEQVDRDPISDFENLLDEVGSHELSILITHPGYVDADLLDASSFHIIRARDLELVTSPRIRDLLANRGIELTNFTDAGLA